MEVINSMSTIDMKRRIVMGSFIVSLLAFLIVLFPGCGGLQGTYLTITNNTNVAGPKILAAVEARDVSALEAMMCQNIKDNVPDLSERISELLDMVDGEIIESLQNSDSVGSYHERDRKGRSITQVGIDFQLTTSTGIYNIHVWWETSNNFAPKEVGIRRITLVDEDKSMRLAFISATEGVEQWHD
jgi:hypothetical protein